MVVTHSFPHRYLSTVTVSLFVINLVPAPILDGAEVFRTTMEMLQQWANGESEYDLEAHASSIRQADGVAGWAGWVSRGVGWASIGMLLCVGFLSLVQ